MLPFPTANAIAAFSGSVLMLAVGIANDSAVAVIFAGTVLLGLGAALAWTLPLGARLRAKRLSLSWWYEQGQGHGHAVQNRGAVLAGVPFTIHASLQHESDASLVVRELSPALPAHVSISAPQTVDLLLPSHCRTEFTLTLVAPSAGRVVLQGLALTVPGPLDLFRAPLYFPSPLVVKVLPRSLVRSTALVRTSPGLGVERVGRAQRRMRGGGSDLHELRELLPGDPFKSIAWKASAKTGRLMVREVEAEVQETLHIVVDVSGSMRGGPMGSRKLDHAIELATLTARHALTRGDRVGLITVDGRILEHVSARDGVAHLPAMQEALLSALEVVDQDLTEPDDDELLGVVGRYLRSQDGLFFVPGEVKSTEALLRHVRAALALDHEARESGAAVVASDARGQLLRRFCRARGIALRYRAETRGFAKAAGLAKALVEAAGSGRVPRSILLITDFDGMASPEPLLKTLRLLRVQSHSVTCVFPEARSALGAAESPLLDDLHLVYGLGEERRMREARAMLGKLGIPLVVSERRAPSAQRPSEHAA